MTHTPREVELPCCEVCGRIGQLPRSIARRDHCNGGFKNPHRQVRMKAVKFQEVEAAA